MVAGLLAFGASLLHATLGPIDPEPTLVRAVQEKVEEAGSGLSGWVFGAPPPPPAPKTRFEWDLWVHRACVVLAVVSILGGVVAYVRREPGRWVAAAWALGAATLAAQVLWVAVASVLVMGSMMTLLGWWLG